MNPNISFESKILEFIKKNQPTRAVDIQKELKISPPTLFKHLKKLQEKGKISKNGKVPNVRYVVSGSYSKAFFPLSMAKIPREVINLVNSVSTEKKDEFAIKPQPAGQNTHLVENNFMYISPEGYVFYGYTGFCKWCEKQNLEIAKTLAEYNQIWQKYLPLVQKPLPDVQFIDAKSKLEESFLKTKLPIFLDGLFYLNFYSIERFGKTKLAQLTFQAKQSQDFKMVSKIAKQTLPSILYLIDKLEISAVAFVPPTVDRKTQFQEEFAKEIDLPLPVLPIQKIIYDTPVQQKSLKSLGDRIINASKTFTIKDKTRYQNLLLIDDFVGSGASLNEIAKKLKNNQNAQKVYGLGITGSLKGFEVINQV